MKLISFKKILKITGGGGAATDGACGGLGGVLLTEGAVVGRAGACFCC